MKLICEDCLICCANRRSYQPGVHLQLQPYSLGDLAQREAVAMDVATLPWGAHGFRHVLGVVGMLTKFAELILLKDQRADTVVQSFRLVGCAGTAYLRF